MVWSGAFPIMIGLAAIAFSAQSMCHNQNKSTTEYQVALLAAFMGVLCAFCGIAMMGSGLGMNLFTGGQRPIGGGGYGGGGYGGGGYGGMW